MANNTIFMSPEESERIQRKIQEVARLREEQTGQTREPTDPKSLIEQAISTSLMQEMSSAAFGSGAPRKAQGTMAAYGIGRPYPPSTARLADLQPMGIKDLRMETHHRGCFLSLRRVSPVAILQAISWTVVKGQSSDDVERLEIFLHTSQYGDNTLEVASELVIKEPYYTLNAQGECTIRIDHPSDLIVIAISENPESWRDKEHYSGRPDLVSPDEYKKKGNYALLNKKNYTEAYFWYTEGLKLAGSDEGGETLRRDLHRNRAHVNIHLKRFDEAISDALDSLTSGESEELKSLDEKAYNRAGLAAYSRGEFLQARRYFEQQRKLRPDDQQPKLRLRRVDARLREEANGTYNMSKIVSNLSKTGGRPDTASYYGSTEIKNSPGAGRGLFATRGIEPNEIILCEKAFCAAWSHETETFTALACDLREDAAIKVFPAGLHRAVMKRLLNNPSQVEKVLSLHGDYRGLGAKLQEVDGSPVIDTFQIHDIIQRNAFGLGQQTEDEDVSNAGTGLWIRASYINHSCIPNAKKDFVGDLIVFRAMRRITAGEEITHSYYESSDYESRETNIQRTWNFKCRCQLCLVEGAENKGIRERRRQAEEKVNNFAEANSPYGASRIMVIRAKMLRQTLNETYDEKSYKGLPRRALSVIDEWLRIASTR
ncbi:Histone-lysine N-methyltransferase ASHR1 [Fusarium oxysporum f. sp. rapae]|uniref:Histone-lysine N-methyltransferase ASHR1 n=1 Tax=Fusarium oxysporum f. sp. rapae TaxID=485398 RepID=A0A8J5NIS9_FUSOX|nr:Histone-lysine N-methyltransferase ASHR1 [Fusarium oxysporum f. sp. rapae]